MSQSQIQARTRQDGRQATLLRSHDEDAEREEQAAGADMIAAQHPQRILGNAALSGLAGAHRSASTDAGAVAAIAGRIAPTIQAKLMLGPADDAYEREADAVADRVVQQSAQRGASTPVQRSEGGEEEDEEMQMSRAGSVPASAVVQRSEGSEEEDEEMQMSRAGSVPASAVLQRSEGGEEEDEEMQMARAGGSSAAGGELVPDVEAEVNSARAGGTGLPASVRANMEQSIGADFSGVRVHTDAAADTLNRKLNARAFTTGSDIFFRGGEYNPAGGSGQHLLAHELTHVVHQGGAPQVQTQRAGNASPARDEK